MRRYKADIKTTHERSWGDWVEYHEVQMKESKSGDWVPFQNAHDAIQMLNKRAARLEARIRRLEDELFLHCAHLPE